MFVALARVRILLPGNHSLKGKRHVLRRVVERIRARHPVSVGEVGEQDKWQVALIGIAAVGNEASFVRSVVDAAVGAIGGNPDAPIAGIERGLLGPERLSLEEAGGSFDLDALAERFEMDEEQDASTGPWGDHERGRDQDHDGDHDGGRGPNDGRK